MAVRANRILKLTALGLCLLAVGVGYAAVKHRRSEQIAADARTPALGTVAPLMLSKVEHAQLSADGDTTRDTVATLVAEVKSLKSEVTTLTDDNQKLRKENSDLSGMERTIQSRIDARDAQRQQQYESQAADLGQQQEHTNRILNSFEEKLANLSRRASGGGNASSSDIPVGFGLQPGESAAATTSDTIIWIVPLNAVIAPRKASATSANSELGPQLKVPRSLDELAQRTQQKLLPDLPVYTINRDATLIGSVSMTALIGRIPIGGQVTDPYPFKILIGANNLAANGIEIPGLETMIMSGTATGDWALACVRGEISSATFVFRDGTIRSFPKPERNDKGTVSGARRKSFGYLSDKFGIPCITGERKTNAVEYLTTRVGLAAAQAAAEASAAAQTSTVMSPQTGAVASAVTGNPSLYAKNKAIASGIQESSTWVRERQAQSFDAIFVRGGADVAVHIDEEIPIDYEFSGRRVNHHAAVPWNDGATVRATLD